MSSLQMMANEFNEGIKRGLKRWIKEEGAEETLAQIDKVAQEYKRVKAELEKEHRKLVDSLPLSLASYLGLKRGPCSIVPHIYYWMEKYGGTFEEAKKKLIDRMKE